MFDKKKQHFWELVVVFGAITILALAISFGYGQNKRASMMDSGMADMMGMHLQNVTVAELIMQRQQPDLQPGFNGMSGHHGNAYGFLYATHQLTTGSIITMLPFIIAGAVFLAVVWIKQ